MSSILAGNSEKGCKFKDSWTYNLFPFLFFCKYVEIDFNRRMHLPKEMYGEDVIYSLASSSEGKDLLDSRGFRLRSADSRHPEGRFFR